ncbi:MAG TPA: hypothetical protein VIH52_02510 [Candidatus Nanoarchaeia archaeon]
MSKINVLEKVKKIEKDVQKLKAEVVKPTHLSEELLDKRDAQLLKRAVARKEKEGWLDLDTLLKTYRKEGLTQG